MASNQKIPWDDKYKIGIENIDIQHKKLFDLVNDLYDLDTSEDNKEEIRVILYRFSDYMQTHFQDEEKYMLSIGYPQLDKHKKIHKGIIDALSLIIHTPAKLSIIQTKMRVVAKRYLVDHIIREDSKIKKFQLTQEEDEEFDLIDL